MKSPVYNVLRVPVEQIRANEYNPNHVATPELRLLYESIKEDGYTMPIVCYRNEHDGVYEIVDGFHRYTVLKTYPDIYEREGGFLPVVVIDKPISERMASTVRHNRARGSHNIKLMCDLVASLVQAGKSDEWIARNLGMEIEEVFRLKQLVGIPDMFKTAGFGQAWKPEKTFK